MIYTRESSTRPITTDIEWAIARYTKKHGGSPNVILVPMGQSDEFAGSGYEIEEYDSLLPFQFMVAG